MKYLKSLVERLKGVTATGLQPRRVLALGEALPYLVPKVRPRFQYEALTLRLGGACPIFRPLADILALSLVVDGPDGELEVGLTELEAWGADFDLLLQKARANLLLRGGEEHFRRVRPGLFRSTWQDNLDGSRMLLPGMLKGLPLRGEPVVALPNRDTLLVAGADDPDALGWMLEAALEFLREDPRYLHGCPLRLEHFQWEVWQSPQGPVAESQLARIQKRRLAEEYARQKALLDRLHGRAGKAVAVEPLHLNLSSSGRVTSCTFWSESVEEGWLPEADFVGVGGAALGEEGRLWVPWAQVWGQLGHLLEPVGLFPERYRFRSFPRAELLAMAAPKAG